RGQRTAAVQEPGDSNHDNAVIDEREEQPEVPALLAQFAEGVVPAEQPEEAPALVEAGEDARPAQKQEAGGSEDDADEVPRPGHERRARAAVDQGQAEAVERQGKEKGHEDQRRYHAPESSEKSCKGVF